MMKSGSETMKGAVSVLADKILATQEIFRENFGAVRVDVGFEIDPRIPKQGCHIQSDNRDKATLSWGRTEGRGWDILLSTKTLGANPVSLDKCPPRYMVSGAAEIPRLAETLRRECAERLERIQKATSILDALIGEHS